MRAAFVAPEIRSASIRAVNYHPLVERLRTTRAGLPSRPLKTFVRSLGSAYAAVLTRVDCAPGAGDELLSQVDAFACEPAGRWIRGDLMPFVDELRIERGDILVAGAGQIGPGTMFGRSVIADARLAGKLAAGDLLSMRGGGMEDDDLLYLYAFLCSTAGVAAVRACAYGTSIPRIRTDLFAMIPVPRASAKQTSRAATLVREAIAHREEYARRLGLARAAIEALPTVQEAHGMCADRRARCLVWDGSLRSICAWNAVSAGEALPFLQRAWRSRLADLITEDGLFYGLLRQRTPTTAGIGVPLITQRDAQSVRQLPTWIARPNVPDAALFSPPNSLVVPGRGTLGEGEVFGRPILLTPGLSVYALTQDLLRVVPRAGFTALVHLFLSTRVGLRLVRSAAVGTKILQLRLDLMRELPIPELSDGVAQKVGQHHEAAVEAFDRASVCEAAAVRVIEEEVLPQWLA
ncbi:hypothetical protein K2Z84_14635 [Candidatus Binatia bacterium]|nr:hypothetical protein [Candidatus Binatia bacterium]